MPRLHEGFIARLIGNRKARKRTDGCLQIFIRVQVEGIKAAAGQQIQVVPLDRACGTQLAPKSVALAQQAALRESAPFTILGKMRDDERNPMQVWGERLDFIGRRHPDTSA